MKITIETMIDDSGPEVRVVAPEDTSPDGLVARMDALHSVVEALSAELRELRGQTENRLEAQSANIRRTQREVEQLRGFPDVHGNGNGHDGDRAHGGN